jgi:hypothetical protein
MSIRFGKVIGSLVAAGLCCGSLSAHADIKYPSVEDLRGFQTVCAGGSVKEINAHLDGALQTWRLKPGARLAVNAELKDVGAVIEKMKSSEDSKLYEAYAECVEKLILNYLQMVNAAAAPHPAPAAADKPRS